MVLVCVVDALIGLVFMETGSSLAEVMEIRNFFLVACSCARHVAAR